MPLIETKNKPICKLTGIHLYHFGLSNCSQRVRLVLEEKQLKWSSHYIDLGKLENLGDAYRQVNAKGIVPTLVHDGKIITESIDIIQYIDKYFPNPSLQSSSKHGRENVKRWLAITDAIQKSIKTLTYELFFKPKGLFGTEQIDYYIKNQTNPEQVEFINLFSKGFPKTLIDSCKESVNEMCQEMEIQLIQSQYLAGKMFSLADIAAVVNIHRLKMLQLEVANSQSVSRWYDEVSNRPSFKRAVLDFVP